MAIADIAGITSGLKIMLLITAVSNDPGAHYPASDFSWNTWNQIIMVSAYRKTFSFLHIEYYDLAVLSYSIHTTTLDKEKEGILVCYCIGRIFT